MMKSKKSEALKRLEMLERAVNSLEKARDDLSYFEKECDGRIWTDDETKEHERLEGAVVMWGNKVRSLFESSKSAVAKKVGRDSVEILSDLIDAVQDLVGCLDAEAGFVEACGSDGSQWTEKERWQHDYNADSSEEARARVRALAREAGKDIQV